MPSKRATSMASGLADGFMCRILAASFQVLILSVSFCLAATIVAAPGDRVEGLIELCGDSGQELSLTFPESVSEWCLVPSDDPSERQIALEVRASSPWTITASMDRTDGKMAQYDLGSSEYVASGMTLEHPLQVFWQNGHDRSQMIELLSGRGMINGRETGEAGEEVALTLLQPVSWNDEPLPYGQVYRIELTFSIVAAG